MQLKWHWLTIIGVTLNSIGIVLLSFRGRSLLPLAFNVIGLLLCLAAVLKALDERTDSGAKRSDRF